MIHLERHKKLLERMDNGKGIERCKKKKGIIEKCKALFGHINDGYDGSNHFKGKFFYRRESITRKQTYITVININYYLVKIIYILFKGIRFLDNLFNLILSSPRYSKLTTGQSILREEYFY
jgi:hypothetical protein